MDNFIERLELAEYLDELPDALSKGTKQKLMVACAVLRNFDLFVADEPFTADELFTGFDPK